LSPVSGSDKTIGLETDDLDCDPSSMFTIRDIINKYPNTVLIIVLLIEYFMSIEGKDAPSKPRGILI